MVISTLYAGGALALCLLVASYLRRLFRLRNYPSAPGHALAGYTDAWYLWKLWERKFQDWNVEQHVRHGPILRITPEMYSLSDPSAVKQIYSISSPMIKAPWYKIWGDPMRPNLFAVTDRHLHSVMRRAVANLYSMTAIKSYERYVDNCVTVLLEQFGRLAAEGAAIDLQRWMQAYAFDVIGEITFGRRIGFMESGGQDVDGIVENLENSLSFGSLSGVDKKLSPFWFAIFGHPIKGLVAFQSKLMQRRQEIGSSGAQDDFYSKCEALREKDPESFEKSGQNQVLIANLGAGSDTTSIALTSAIFHIVNNRDVYLRLREELREAEDQGLAHDPISFDEAQALPYLQRVLKEALRIHPSTGLPLWRVVPEGGMEISGKYFPPGAVVGVNVWVAHHNPDVFESPGTFLPDRWDPDITPKDRLKLMEACYIPFGSGTRTCIGKNISLLEMTKLIPQLLKNYDFELVSPQGGQAMESDNRWFVKQKNVFMKLRARNI